MRTMGTEFAIRTHRSGMRPDSPPNHWGMAVQVLLPGTSQGRSAGEKTGERKGGTGRANWSGGGGLASILACAILIGEFVSDGIVSFLGPTTTGGFP